MKLYAFTQNRSHGQIHSYVGIAGAAPDPAGRTTGTLARNAQAGYGRPTIANTGMLIVNETVTLAQCLDGTSNTIMVGEQSGFVKSSFVPNDCEHDDCRNGAYGGWAGFAGGMVTVAGANTGIRKPLKQWGCNMGAIGIDCPCQTNMASGDLYYPVSTGGVTTVVAASNSGGNPSIPNIDPRTNNVSPNGGLSVNTLLNSMHTRGINVILADGSVRYISDSIALRTFQQACVRDDGSVMGVDW